MSCGRTGRLGNIAFKKEAVWGTYLTPDIYLRALSESMNRAVEHATDDSLVKEIYTTDMIKVADGAGGSIEGNMHGDTLGPLLHGVMGAEATPADPFNAALTASYKGSVAYARITKATTNITFETSPDGSVWTPDAGIGVAGVIDISLPANDTFAELVAAINLSSDWNATLISGAGTEASSNIADFSATNTKSAGSQDGSIIMKGAITASTVSKEHILTPADAGTCLPSFSFLVNRVLGTDKSVAFTGTKFSSIALSNAAKDLGKISITADSKAEVVDQPDVNLTLPTVQAMKTSNMKIITVGSNGSQLEWTEVKDYSITINTNIDENRVIGSLTKLEQIRQSSTMEISFTANNNQAQYDERSAYINDTPIETILYWQSNTQADSTNSIPYSLMIRIPAIKYTDFNSPLSTGDRLTITGAGTVVKPQSATISKHIEISVVDTELTAY